MFRISSPPYFSDEPNVRTRTEKILYSGTALAIISGAMPVFPYMFWMKAMPRMAALERNAPCTKAPTLSFSFSVSSARTHSAAKQTVVTIAQNKTKRRSKLLRISLLAIC